MAFLENSGNALRWFRFCVGLGIPYLNEEEMKSPIALLLSLLTDVRRLEPDVKGLDRDVITIKKRYKDEGDGFLTIALPAYCQALDRGLADGKFACPPGFKRVRGGAIPRLFSGMLCKVFDIETGLLVESPSLTHVKCLREVLRLFKKLGGDDDRADKLDRDARTEFRETDEKCSADVELSEKQLFILSNVSKFILPNLDTFEEGELPCKHGPGAVFESITTNRKWESLLVHSNALDELGFDCVAYGRHGLSDSSNSTEYGVSGDTAKLITVLKSSTARRTITIEPLVRQFVQQGLNTVLRDEISRCSVLRNCLALTDQSKNQQLALEGSRTGAWATIDLKSASDLLSVKVVETVFRFRPRFLSWLIRSRSPKVKDGSLHYDLRKYAGMGNATTFPVQSVVFASLAIAAILEGSLKFPSYVNVMRVSRRVRVYGDDIIVPSEYVHQVADWISRVGLKINVKKTFSTGNFRESCGVDAFLGHEVTPLYVRHCPAKPSIREPDVIAHWVSLSNQAWMRGLYSLSTLLREWVEDCLRRQLPLVRQTSGALGWHDRRNSQEFQRWNPELQRHETRCLVQIPLKRKDPVDGYAALLKFWLTPLLGRDVDHLQKSPVRFSSRIVQRWVP